MCGILGSNVNRDGFFDALQTIEHRGPDNVDYKRVDDFFLGHSRLSIIDLDSEANQPMEFDDIVIVFNGEIYNYKELIKEFNLNCITHSDTEVLIRLYQKFGFEFLKYLNGMFAFAIFDKRKDLIFFARDRFGKKPFYYYHKDGNFKNTTPENTGLICYNCHSLTPTFGSLNKGKGRRLIGNMK